MKFMPGLTMYKMKGYFLAIASIVFCSGILISAKAESQSIPSFTMKLSNGKSFSSKDLSKQKPAIIIYFDPDCDHCQTLINTLLKKINEFKKSQIVMVTFKPLNEVAGFEKKYHTAEYANIRVGTEQPIFFFRTLYHLENVPFTILFNKQGKQIISYKKETPVDDLLKHLKAII